MKINNIFTSKVLRNKIALLTIPLLITSTLSLTGCSEDNVITKTITGIEQQKTEKEFSEKAKQLSIFTQSLGLEYSESELAALYGFLSAKDTDVDSYLIGKKVFEEVAAADYKSDRQFDQIFIDILPTEEEQFFMKRDTEILMKDSSAIDRWTDGVSYCIIRDPAYSPLIFGKKPTSNNSFYKAGEHTTNLYEIIGYMYSLDYEAYQKHEKISTMVTVPPGEFGFEKGLDNEEFDISKVNDGKNPFFEIYETRTKDHAELLRNKQSLEKTR